MTSFDQQLGIATDLAMTMQAMTYSCPCSFGEDERYELIEMIGYGHSEVYAAIDRRLSTEGHPFRVALKLRSDDTIDEAGSGAAVQHRNVAQVLDASVWMGRAYIVQELVGGSTLDECELGVKEVIAAVADVADGLQALHHAGIVHNDVKPRNIVLDETGVPRLIDLDVATRIDANPVGYTSAFKAPELSRSDEARCTPASDIYALAKTLDAVLDGREAPSDIARIIDRATANQPGDRHVSASEFASDLRGVRAHKALSWAPYMPLARTRLWVRRHPLRLAIATLALLAAVSASVAAVSTIRNQQQQVVIAEAAQQIADEQQRELEAKLAEAVRGITGGLRETDRSSILRQFVYLDALGMSGVLDIDGVPVIPAAKIVDLTGLLDSSPPNTIDGLMIRYSLAFLLIGRGDIKTAREVIDEVSLETLMPDEPTRVGFEVMLQICSGDLADAARAAAAMGDDGLAIVGLIARFSSSPDAT